MDFDDYIAPIPFDMLYDLEIGMITSFGTYEKHKF